ncbi:MAG: DNA polymerase III subunit delta' [Clostridia bacterium]|nr:DNA polymerase III subunit delta' [Clostridia bacterium]
MVEIIGHKKVKKQLEKTIETNSIGHAYLFVGKNGIGKKLLAKEFAKSVMCENSKNLDYCDNCDSCFTFESGSDFKIIYPTKNVIKVDEIRDFCSELFLLPTKSKRKVFIIDDAECMNEQAQNALLKVLEEPPLYATIILITANKEKLLNTIKSRVIEIQFDFLTDDEIKKILSMQGVEWTEDTIKYASGSAKKALDFIQDDIFDISKDLAELLIKRNFLLVNRKFEEIKADKKLKSNISAILEKVMQIFFINLKNDISFDYKLIEKTEEAIQKIKRNANVDLALDSLMIEVCKF